MQINRELFEAWLFAQPKDRDFNYVNGLYHEEPPCVMCGFLREQGYRFQGLDNRELLQLDDKRIDLPDWFIRLMDARPGTFFSAGQVQDLYLKHFPDTFSTPTQDIVSAPSAYKATEQP